MLHTNHRGVSVGDQQRSSKAFIWGRRWKRQFPLDVRLERNLQQSQTQRGRPEKHKLTGASATEKKREERIHGTERTGSKQTEDVLQTSWCLQTEDNWPQMSRTLESAEKPKISRSVNASLASTFMVRTEPTGAKQKLPACSELKGARFSYFEKLGWEDFSLTFSKSYFPIWYFLEIWIIWWIDEESLRICFFFLNPHPVTFGEVKSQEAGESHHRHAGVQVRGGLTQEPVRVWRSDESVRDHIRCGRDSLRMMMKPNVFKKRKRSIWLAVATAEGGTTIRRKHTSIRNDEMIQKRYNKGEN